MVATVFNLFGRPKTSALGSEGHRTATPPPCEQCTLDAMRKGESFEIVGVDDEHARIQALRFGMAEGACVECITRIPAGPLVLKSGRQEIAVGRGLARRIRVRRHES